jgi:hypothetical protein
MSDTTDNYLLLVNNKLLNCMSFIDKQQLDILLQYYEQQILVSTSNCSWYEFLMEILKHIDEKYTSTQS